MSASPDTFRKQYVPLDNIAKSHIDNIKDLAAQLEEAIDIAPSTGREKALAKTKLEESVMWAVKGVTGAQPSNG